MQDYQLTKTIRFKLSPVQNALEKEVNVIRQNQGKAAEEIAEFNRLAKALAKEVESYLFTQSNDEQQSLRLNYHLEVKKNWLKQYTKAHYHVWNTAEHFKLRSHKISQVFYLKGELLNWRDNWNSLVNQLAELENRHEENLPRRAEFALLIAEFSKKNNFRFMRDFVNESQDKTNDTLKNNLLKLLTQLEESLAQCEQQYLPDQSKGLIIARASLNYYTINKKPRDYFDEIEKKRADLDGLIKNSAYEIQKAIHINKSHALIISAFVVQYVFNTTDENITLDSLYQQMKIYKATEKKRFEEAVDKGLEYNNLKKQHPLFDSKEDCFSLFVRQTKAIKKLGERIAKLDKASADYSEQRKKIHTKSTEIKQQRGKDFFFLGNNKPGAKQYKKFCNLYKEVAMKRGKIVAEIKGIERDKIDSQLLNYWALMIEKESQHQLLLIPKDKAAKAYRKLDEERDAPQSSISIHYFKSLTMRALKKLCFGTQGNTFIAEIKQELKNEYPEIQGAFSLANFQSEAEIVQFYQHVLDTNYVKDNLDVHNFEGLDTLVKNREIKGLDDFERGLEKICYKKRILAGKTLEGYLRQECDAQFMKITSYDLTKHSSRKGKDKQHTQIWQQFWSQNNANTHYPVRLNPELKISWRKPKESRVAKYGKDSDKNNRYLHPQFTLATTITENANGKRLDLAFTNQETLAEKIKKFNQSFNKEHAKDPHAMYFYGIDRGQAELATLALVSRFTKEKNEHGQPIPEFATFSVYRLKDDCLNYSEKYKCDGKPKSRLAIKNLSYFIDNNANIFEQNQTASLDLTTAKLIKGKIIENGDVLSYLRLKELSAKRRLYEYFSQANIDFKQPQVIYFKDNKFCAHTLNNNPQAKVYYYRPDLEKICTKDSIQKMLNDYLHELQDKKRERDILTVEKINHLRDAMAANMVGIIAHLYQKYPGIIALEDLSESELTGHFNQSNENISRRLEWRLYNKFQNLGLVPPRLKDSILLRKDKDITIKQFGLIHFIKTEGTSKNCPYCGEKNTKSEGEWNNDKHNLRVFDCTNSKCVFNTKTNRKGIESLNNPDSVASYNIAKRGFEYVLNPPQLKNKKQSQTRNNQGKITNHNQPQKNKNNKPRQQQATQNDTFKAFKGLDKIIKKQDK